MKSDRLLTAQEVADYLAVKKSTVYGWTHTDSIPYHKLGNLIRFRKEDIDDWLENTVKVKCKKIVIRIS